MIKPISKKLISIKIILLFKQVSYKLFSFFTYYYSITLKQSFHIQFKYILSKVNHLSK
jgi:hypothetical protein